jgi:hypothetical protein
LLQHVILQQSSGAGLDMHVGWNELPEYLQRICGASTWFTALCATTRGDVAEDVLPRQGSAVPELSATAESLLRVSCISSYISTLTEPPACNRCSPIGCYAVAEDQQQAVLLEGSGV